MNFDWSAFASDWWNLVRIGFLQGILSAATVGLLLYVLRRKTTVQFRYLLALLLFIKVAAPPLPGWGVFPSLWSPASRMTFEFVPETSSAVSETVAVEDTTITGIEPTVTTMSHTAASPGSMLGDSPWLFLGMIVHLCGTVVLLTLMTRRHWRHWLRLRRTGTLLDHGVWRDDLRKIQTQLGITTRVELWGLPDLGSPVAYGIFRQRILLPQWALHVDSEQRSAILGHELAHIRRRDTWLVWIENTLIAWQWWNPLAHVVRWLLRAERERLCDALVLREQLCSPASYAETLLNALSHLAVHQQLRLGTEMVGNGQRFSQRLEAIMSGSLRSESRLGYFGLASFLALAALILPGLPIKRWVPNAVSPVQADEKQKSGEEGGKAQPKVEPSKSQKLQQMLQSPVTFDFQETTLDDVVRYLRHSTGMLFVLDTHALEKAKITKDTPITLELRNSVPLHNALKIILLELDATAEVHGDLVLITSPKPKVEEIETVGPQGKSEARLKVEKALQKPVKFVFEDTPLHDTVYFFRDMAEVNVVLHRRALKQLGINSDVPVSYQTDGKPFGTAYNEMLSPLGLEAVIRYDVLLITNKPKPAP